MNKIRYNIVFKGQIARGVSQQTVRHNLAKLLKLELAAIERLFSGVPVVLKKEVDLETAQRIKIRIEKTGALCSLISTDRPRSPFVKTSVICSRCGYKQSAGAECFKCGVVFSKYNAVSKRDPEPGPKATKTASGHSHEISPIASKQRSKKILSIISLTIIGILGLGFYLLWSPSAKQKTDVRYNKKQLELFRAKRGSLYRGLVFPVRTAKARGDMNLIYGTCSVSNSEAFVELLKDGDPDRYSEISACMLHFPDVTAIAPLLAWHASMDSPIRLVEDYIKTLFLMIKEPAVAPLVDGLDTHTNSRTRKLIVETLALLNSEASIRSVVQMLEKIPQDLEPISKSFLAMVLCSRHLGAKGAFHLAKDLFSNGSSNTQSSVAYCMALFEGEPVRRLQDKIEVQQRSPLPKVAAEREPKPSENVSETKTHPESESIWNYMSDELYCQSMRYNSSPPPERTKLTVEQFFQKLEEAGWEYERKASMTIEAKGHISTYSLIFERRFTGDMIIKEILLPDKEVSESYSTMGRSVKVDFRAHIDPCGLIKMIDRVGPFEALFLNKAF